MTYIATALIGLLLTYLCLPTMNIWWSDIWLLLLFSAGVPMFFRQVIGRNEMNRATLLRAAPIILGMLMFVVILPVSTWAIHQSGNYRNLLGDVKTSVFTQDIAPVDPAHLRIVDHDMAVKLGSKQLGVDAGLGSRATLGEMHIQRVKDELYWVAPLLHTGFRKWTQFGSDGTPGYVMVSATNPDDVRFVQKIGDKPLHIRYQPNAYFDQDLERHIYMNGYATRGVTDYTFEIDDEGQPYYVATIYNKKIGASGEDATGIVVVDVQTGALKEYSIADAPAWIDRIQPEDFIHNQINWWGEYIHGWWNSMWAHDEILKTSSKELRLVYGSDGRAYWYSGLTSKGKDKSITGFLLIDSRTKVIKRYDVAGATEDEAEKSAEGATQEKKYDATNFILYNIVGKPTYVGPLKDNAGLVKAVAMVSVENYDIVGVGTTKQEALRDYRSKLASRGNAAVSDPLKKREKLSSKVTRFGFDVRNGSTYFHFQLEDRPKHVFVATSGVSVTLPITEKGDKVTIGYSDTGSGTVDIESFTNDSLSGLASTVREDGATARAEAVRKDGVQRGDSAELDARLKAMTHEQRARLLQEMKRWVRSRAPMWGPFFCIKKSHPL